MPYAEYYANNRDKCKAYSKNYYLTNRSKVRTWARGHYKKHKNRISVYHHEWYEQNRESRIAYTREWRKRNPDKVKAICAIQRMNRRARERNAAGFFSYESWMQKVAFHGWKCLYCSRQLDHTTLTIDHRKPLSKGGSNWLANLVPACKSCNSKKQGKYKTTSKE